MVYRKDSDDFVINDTPLGSDSQQYAYNPEMIEIGLEPTLRLTRDLKNAASELGEAEARYLVDYYYQWQKARTRAANVARSYQDESIAPGVEPHAIVNWLQSNTVSIERMIRGTLDVYSNSKIEGQWARSIIGIGPIISAGLLAHIDIRKAETAGAIWRFAGLDPTNSWLGKEKSEVMVNEIVGTGRRNNISYDNFVEFGRLSHRRPDDLVKQSFQMKKNYEGDNSLDDLTKTDVINALAKRPWNADLKTLCWKIADSFVKFQNNPNDVYGKVYVERKAYEHRINEAGGYAERAAEKLRTTNIRKPEVRRTYESGKLTDGHIHASAMRVAVKLFLAHYHHVCYEAVLGETPPKPYVIDRGDHTHFISPPNWPMTTLRPGILNVAD